jgi:hypothetical protein
MKKSFLCYISLLILLAMQCPATEYKPWYGPVLEIEGRANALLEVFSKVNGHHGLPQAAKQRRLKRHANNFFFDVSASIAPSVEWSAELELLLADTGYRSFGFDSVKLTGRHLFFNDIVGDPLSLSLGLSLSKVFNQAWHDLSIFHHAGRRAGLEGEVHLSAGKEWSCMQFWTYRGWAVIGIGAGEVGSPWIRGDLDWELNFWDRQSFKVFAHSLFGLGRNDLNLNEHFRGYGPIQHQSVDVGISFNYLFENQLTLTLEAAYRVFAKNCPERAMFYKLEFLYPFGL